MPYKLRFVQKFSIEHSAEFLEIEKQFEEFENVYPEFPKGKRYLPLSGQNSGNTLIWECDFESFDELIKTHQFLQQDSRHEDLFKLQSKYMLDNFTEIYRPYDS
ncbi:MAG: hypothetical protein ACRCVT_13755 [Leadbetterella sp.]